MADTSQHSDRLTKPARRLRRWVLGLSLATLAMLFCLLRWGGYLLVTSDPLPARVAAAVVLQGSLSGQTARITEAMHLLQQGIAERVLLSVPKDSYWGEPIPPMAHRYLERNYGSEMAARVDFCVTGANVNSTEQEARALSDCIQEHGWQSIAVVTSNYHTRRAGMIWRKVIKQVAPSVHLWIYGAADPEFQPQGWWCVRLYAKTWFLEFVKLVWTRLVG